MHADVRATRAARPIRTAIVAALLVAAPTLAACSSSGSDDADKETTTTAAAETTTTEADATTTTEADGTTTTVASTTTEDNSGDPGKEGTDTSGDLDTLPSGIHYGYFAGIEEGTVEGQAVQVLLWDEVQFLTGDEAVQAAQQHGDIPEDQTFIENDYYIVNDNQHVRRLAIVPDAQVFMVKDGSPDQVASSPDEVSKQQGLFKIEIQNVRDISTITSVEGVFLP